MNQMTKYPYSEFVVEASNETILNESGRKWCQWFSQLESKNYQSLGLIKLREKVEKEYGLDAKISDTIARAFLGRFTKPKPPIKRNVFDVSVSKTFNYPLDQVFHRASDWIETEQRTQLQKQIKLKQLNCKWLSDNSMVELKFHAKGKSKTQMTILHERLENESDAQIMKNYWKERIPKMIETL